MSGALSEGASTGLPPWLDRLNEFVGRAVAWLTLAMVLIMLGIVVARYAFNAGSIAMQESVTYLHAAVFLLGAGYALRNDQHVRVDIFYRGWTQRGRDWVDLIGTLVLLLPMCIFLIVSSLDYVSEAWKVREGSREAGGLPLVYALKTLIPVGAGLLTIEGVFLALRCINRLRS